MPRTAWSGAISCVRGRIRNAHLKAHITSRDVPLGSPSENSRSINLIEFNNHKLEERKIYGGRAASKQLNLFSVRLLLFPCRRRHILAGYRHETIASLTNITRGARNRMSIGCRVSARYQRTTNNASSRRFVNHQVSVNSSAELTAKTAARL